MKMELSAKTAKAFVKAIENLTEICLIVFDEDGVRTRIVNGEHTALPRSQGHPYNPIQYRRPYMARLRG